MEKQEKGRFHFEQNVPMPRPSKETYERLVGLAGADLLVGGGGADEFNGGEGPDVMTGGKDGDIYVFGANGGADIVKDAGGDCDRLVFRDAITIDDLIFTEQTVDLKVTVRDTGDSILLIGWGQFDNYIEELVFDAAVFKTPDIEARITGSRRPKVERAIPDQVARVGERFEFRNPRWGIHQSLIERHA